ncbi:peptidase inhibitor family I36 protein [Streptomyces sp. NPDC093149]|uniref:peptidase inhibitor family I36 protein n=1 Tax=Streptomyces sp. NPDC093149 TaxID=3366031 RepID=UPI00380767E1
MSGYGPGAPTSDNHECRDEHVCLYGGHVGRGATLSTHDAVSGLRAVGFDDRARGAFNSTSDDWCLYGMRISAVNGGSWSPVRPVTSPGSPTGRCPRRGRGLKAAADRSAALGVRCPASVPGADRCPVHVQRWWLGLV